MMAGTGLPVREVTLTSRHLPRRSGPGHALGRSAPGSVACPPGLLPSTAQEPVQDGSCRSGSSESPDLAPKEGHLQIFVGRLDISVPFSRSTSSAGDNEGAVAFADFPWTEDHPPPPNISSQKQHLFSHLGLPSKQSKPVRRRKGSELPRDRKSAKLAGGRPAPRGPAISRVCSMQCPLPSSGGSVIIRRGVG